MPSILSGEQLDYLQRLGTSLPITEARGGFTNIPPALRRMSHVRSVGNLEKLRERAVPAPADIPTKDVLIGLYGYRIPFVFQVIGGSAEVRILLGTWSPVDRENASPAVLDGRQGVLHGLLESLFPAIEINPYNAPPPTMAHAGLVIGIPSHDTRKEQESQVFPLDRLIRALTGVNWSALVLAEPIDESVIGVLRRGVIQDMQSVEALAMSEGTPSPLAKHTLELLEARLKGLTKAMACGAWRTGVYLFGDAGSYYRLSALWRGIFSGEESVLEPIRVQEGGIIGELAQNWALPDMDGGAGSGEFRHPFRFQTLLTSEQLANYAHLPRQETSGFTIRSLPDFDVSPPAVSGSVPNLTLGRVVNRDRLSSAQYALDYKALTRHTFIAGVTGSGKTNTLFYILKQVAALKTPFLVIEPAKAEYRALLHDSRLRDELHIFTPGEERVSPFRVNPFEVVGWPSIAVGVHLDLLRSVFSASFGMWNPLPQILERCLQEIYEDRGWEISGNRNRRLENLTDLASSFPTLTDLAVKVDEVTRRLGYDEKMTSDLRAALLTRVNSLRSGGKGRTLDTPRSLPMEALLQQPCIVELQGMGDDDDKAFLMGLLFIRLVEYRRARPGSLELRHLLVIEEAHRLLTNVGERGQEEGNPRGKAVESFSNLLSEIRAYGQGVLVVDQIPTKLAPDVIKNTNLKIGHRIVAADDRTALGGAMAMNDPQKQALSILGVGQAAVFRDGDDRPLLVQIPPCKDQESDAPPDDATVTGHMQALSERRGYASLFRKSAACTRTCTPDGLSCAMAQRIIEEPRFQSALTRLVLSALTDTDALDRLWPDIESAVISREPLPISTDELYPSLMTHAALGLAERLGARQGWTFGETDTFAGLLGNVLLLRLRDRPAERERAQWQQHALATFARCFSPCPACGLIYGQPGSSVCIYRAAASDLVASGQWDAVWTEARATDIAVSPQGSPETWSVCQKAGYEIVEFPEEDHTPGLRQQLHSPARTASLCFGQQMLSSDASNTPRELRQIMSKLATEAPGTPAPTVIL